MRPPGWGGISVTSCVAGGGSTSFTTRRSAEADAALAALDGRLRQAPQTGHPPDSGGDGDPPQADHGPEAAAVDDAAAADPRPIHFRSRVGRFRQSRITGLSAYLILELDVARLRSVVEIPVELFDKRLPCRCAVLA